MSDTTSMRHIDINEDMCCCGIKEISGIKSYKPTDIILDVAHRLFSPEYERDNSCAFMLFSDTGKKESGKNLAKEITKLKLGNITKTKSKRNPNSDNSLAVWMWELSLLNLRKYYQVHKKDYVRSSY